MDKYLWRRKPKCVYGVILFDGMKKVTFCPTPCLKRSLAQYVLF